MKKIHKKIERYYSEKIIIHGATPEGVDWNGEDGQNLRFQQISKVIDGNFFSINDIGCGYGKYCQYLNDRYEFFDYYGYDLSSEMIETAKSIYPNFIFIEIDNLNQVSYSDYSVASGIFNVKMNYSDSEWLSYVLQTIDQIDNISKRGFAFNCLTSYSDNEKKRDYLYYANPCEIFNYCKTKFSRNVSLLHDYDLYEFTIIVKKQVF